MENKEKNVTKCPICGRVTSEKKISSYVQEVEDKYLAEISELKARRDELMDRVYNLEVEIANLRNRDLLQRIMNR